jgi:hypothetical protein
VAVGQTKPVVRMTQGPFWLTSQERLRRPERVLRDRNGSPQTRGLVAIAQLLATAQVCPTATEKALVGISPAFGSCSLALSPRCERDARVQWRQSRFCFVAPAATTATQLLQLAAGPKQKQGEPPITVARCPLVRGSSRLRHLVLTARFSPMQPCDESVGNCRYSRKPPVA